MPLQIYNKKAPRHIPNKVRKVNRRLCCLFIFINVCQQQNLRLRPNPKMPQSPQRLRLHGQQHLKQRRQRRQHLHSFSSSSSSPSSSSPKSNPSKLSISLKHLLLRLRSPQRQNLSQLQHIIYTSHLDFLI